MRTRIGRWGEDYDVLRWDDEPEVDPEPLDDHQAAGQFLRRSLGDYDDMQELRRLYYEDHPAGEPPPSDEELIDRLAWRVGQGDLRIVRHVRHEVPRPAALEEDEPARPRPQETTTWIEIMAVDENGEQVPGVSYRVTREGGGVVASGAVDDEGLARVEELQPGSYKVSFPHLDQNAWSKHG